jgi:hypothetical protein
MSPPSLCGRGGGGGGGVTSFYRVRTKQVFKQRDRRTASPFQGQPGKTGDKINGTEENEEEGKCR